ncbi:MAG: ATP-binding cassette domain-containing protein, partial [Acidimicrobiales bacterium]
MSGGPGRAPMSGGPTSRGPTSRGPTSRGPVLQLADVNAGYGRFRALFDVSLEVAEGSSLAIVGPNGAGKTTLARVCSALVHPTSGRVSFAGRDMAGLSPNDLARTGLVHVPEGRAVFGGLTVEENLELAFGAS